MAIPHDVQKRLIRARLSGKEGKARIEEIKKLEEELPKYNTGPYGKIRQWLKEELKKARTTSNIKHVDWLGVPRQGDKQFVLVGSPSVGKSSLLSKLSGMNIKIAEYNFTTIKPIPAIVKINNSLIQIVDLPGLIEGAVEDKGGGRRLIGIVKESDGVIIMADLTRKSSDVEKIIKEIKKARIEKKSIFVGNKIDLKGSRENLKNLERKYKREVIGISAKTGEGINRLKEAIWELTELIRVYPEYGDEPVILEKGSKVEDFARKIHREIFEKFKEAVINGPSAKFPNQVVGLEHVLEDKDHVKIIIHKG